MDSKIIEDGCSGFFTESFWGQNDSGALDFLQNAQGAIANYFQLRSETGMAGGNHWQQNDSGAPDFMTESWTAESLKTGALDF